MILVMPMSWLWVNYLAVGELNDKDQKTLIQSDIIWGFYEYSGYVLMGGENKLHA